MYEKAGGFLNSLEFDERYIARDKIPRINNWNYTPTLDYLVPMAPKRADIPRPLNTRKRLSICRLNDDRLRSTGLGYIIYGGPHRARPPADALGMWDAARPRSTYPFRIRNHCPARYQAVF